MPGGEHAVALEGAILLPDGTAVRGRALRAPVPPGPRPDFGLYLGSARLRAATRVPGWQHRWLAWPDFWLPRDRDEAYRAISDLHDRARRGERVEVACGGGVGRTGTVISCLAVLAGVPGSGAVSWTRRHHHPRAVETPWQRRWVRRFAAEATGR